MKCAWTLLASLILPALAWAQDQTHRDMQEMLRLHQDSKAYIAMLEDPNRDEYQKPHEAETPVGPPVEVRIARDDLVKVMEANGFQVQAEHTFLPDQYFIVFTVKKG